VRPIHKTHWGERSAVTAFARPDRLQAASSSIDRTALCGEQDRADEQQEQHERPTEQSRFDPLRREEQVESPV